MEILVFWACMWLIVIGAYILGFRTGRIEGILEGRITELDRHKQLYYSGENKNEE